MNKEVIFGKEAREILLKGVNLICDAVKITLGPKGKNVILSSDYMNPRILNDGVTIANEIETNDEFLNIGINIVKEAAIKTNDIVGDGTTTSLVILKELFNESIKEINSGCNPVKLKKEINNALEKVIKYINRQSKKIKTLKEIENVALVSSCDKDISNIIKKAYQKIGLNGNIILEDSKLADNTLEFVNGLEIKNGYISNDLLSENTRECELNKVDIIVHNDILSSVNFEIKNNTLILADDFEEEVINYFIDQNKLNKYKVILVKLPFYSEVRKEFIKDIKIFINNNTIDKVKFLKNKTILINEKNNDENKILERVEFIKKEMSECEGEFEKEILQ